MHSTPSLRCFPNVAFETVPKFDGLTMALLALSGKITQYFLFLHLSHPGDQWCGVLGFVLAGNVASSGVSKHPYFPRHKLLTCDGCSA